MGRKAKRKIARLQHEQRQTADAYREIQGWNRNLRDDVARKREQNDVLGRKLRHVADDYHRELARYKFIDDILTRMSNDPEFRGMPLFRYMQGEHHRMAPDSWCGQFPPLMRQSIMPQLSWNRIDVDPEVQAMTVETLEYYLFRQGVHWGHEKYPQPVVEYELNGERRSYILARDLMKLPEAEALQIVMREIAPAVLAMFKEIANRG